MGSHSMHLIISYDEVHAVIHNICLHEGCMYSFPLATPMLLYIIKVGTAACICMLLVGSAVFICTYATAHLTIIAANSILPNCHHNVL